MNPLEIMVFLGILTTFAAFGVVFGSAFNSNEKRKKRRIESVRARVRGAAAIHSAKTSESLKKNQNKSFPIVETLIKRYLPRRQMLADRLARTGRDIAIGTYVLINLGIATAVFMVVAVAFRQSLGVAMLLGIVAGVGIPYMATGMMAGNRIKAFTAQFPDAIDLIVRGLKAGLPVTESIASVGREMADPVGAEFRQISDSIKFGRSLEDTMWATAKRLDTPEFKFFVISLSVQRETGGNLSEALANLSDILRRRRQMKLKIKAMSSEAKASAIILGSLPFIMFGIIFAMSPEYEMQLFTDPRGQMMLGVGLFIMSIGITVMNKMVRFEI